MAFLGGVLAFSLVVPSFVDAQEARVRADQVTVFGSTGADRVRMETGPGLSAFVNLLDNEGHVRTQLANGGVSSAGGSEDSSSLNIFLGTGQRVVRLGTGRGPQGDEPQATSLALRDQAGNLRVRIQVTEDGTPSIALLDASGNTSWSAP
jgi:hypothetical protein